MPKSYVCSECQKLFVRKSSRHKHHLFRHRETTKSRAWTLLNQSFQCPFCENEVSSFKSRKDVVSHIDAFHLENLNYSLHKSALNGKIKFYRKHIFSKETLLGFVLWSNVPTSLSFELVTLSKHLKTFSKHLKTG